MLALLLNIFLARLPKCRAIGTRILRAVLLHKIKDLVLMQSAEEVMLATFANDIEKGMTPRQREKLTKAFVKLGKLSKELGEPPAPFPRFVFSTFRNFDFSNEAQSQAESRWEFAHPENGVSRKRQNTEPLTNKRLIKKIAPECSLKFSLNAILNAHPPFTPRPFSVKTPLPERYNTLTIDEHTACSSALVTSPGEHKREHAVNTPSSVHPNPRPMPAKEPSWIQVYSPTPAPTHKVGTLPRCANPFPWRRHYLAKLIRQAGGRSPCPFTLSPAYNPKMDTVNGRTAANRTPPPSFKIPPQPHSSDLPKAHGWQIPEAAGRPERSCNSNRSIIESCLRRYTYRRWIAWTPPAETRTEALPV